MGSGDVVTRKGHSIRLADHLVHRLLRADEPSDHAFIRRRQHNRTGHDGARTGLFFAQYPRGEAGRVCVRSTSSIVRRRSLVRVALGAVRLTAPSRRERPIVLAAPRRRA